MNAAVKEGLRCPSVVIIGAGMTGILLTIKLREAGITDVIILEKKGTLGGTWRENSYPGVACDVPAHLYAYSFEPNLQWSKRFAGGAEIREYFERVARKYGVKQSIRFNEVVISSVYDRGKWTVTTSTGEIISADFVINATGILHHPAKPHIKGLDSFEGKVFHTAEWDHSVDLKGKKVGVIGTGSTACQVIPELAREVEALSVFQRTPQWILPIGNKRFSEKTKARLSSNPNRVRRLAAAYAWGMEHILTKAVTGHRLQNWFFTACCKLNLRFAVRDKALRERLTPDYRVGCKRVVVNTTFYPAIQRGNVDLVTSAIDEITPEGIRTRDGTLHKLDALVLATGFNPTAYMRPMEMRGKEGVTIDESWAKKIRTYRSLCMPGFPNNFLMLGPNTPIGNFSVIAMSEVQCAYIIKLIRRWQRYEFDEIDVSMKAVERFAEQIRAGMGKTVWVGGCQSWYLDADGDPILWPYTWQRWENEMAEPAMQDFHQRTYAPQQVRDPTASGSSVQVPEFVE